MKDLPWEKVDFYFGDERCVSQESPESNFRMAQETLFQNVPIPRDRVHRIEGERSDRDQAARDYEAMLPDSLDLILLGMGVDGHTASLFPGSSALSGTERGVLAVEGPYPPRWRITITPLAIQEARSTLVLVSGREKASMLVRALEGDYRPQEIPVQLALPGTWIVDRDAASELTKA